MEAKKKDPEQKVDVFNVQTEGKAPFYKITILSKMPGVLITTNL